MRKLLILAGMATLGTLSAEAQNIRNNPGSNHGNDFEQLGTILPTPNSYRTASGAAGPEYWQQRADYKIKCTLDESATRLTGSETITYFNNSPDQLTYIWLQLDENQHSVTNNSGYQTGSNIKGTDLRELERLDKLQTDNSYGDNITGVTNAAGQKLPYTINKTMMRIDLPTALAPHQQLVFTVNWNYKISDRLKYGGRGGYEYFPEDGNILFTMTQWYPRLCVYSDFQGWQNHQFVGSGEFALTFGNFNVEITVPADHIVGGTGECQNYASVLNPARLARWQKAQTSTEPVEIVTLAEAREAEKHKATNTKTWIFKADNVRDFAWTSSRKFVWDAMPASVEKKKVMCMSFYGKEAYNLWRRYSTKVIAHTVQSYSKFTIPYPYPVAQSIEASNGMEYPMICFNNGRTDKDGTYTEATKNGMIGVIIHEVGHNFFPMIVNSDERQWTWMDEGLNTFVEYLTEELWDNKFPSRRGPAWTITDYMKLPKDQLEPIMTNSENIIQFGPNAYSKPATGLNILRETIMGRELFDYAFKEYARRWAFKHPTPADLFRTMEDASGEDLDWFWRGWFYGTNACDISLDSVKSFVIGDGKTVAMQDPRPARKENLAKPIVPQYDDISKIRNREDKNIRFMVDKDTSLQDFYYRYDRGIIPYDSTYTFTATRPAPEPLDDSTSKKFAGRYLYQLSFTNKGGLVMPVIVEWTYEDGTKEIEKIAAQVWRKDEKHFDKVFLKNKAVASVQLDPLRETADIDLSNNQWPKIDQPTRFDVFKGRMFARGASQGGMNPMQKSNQ